MVFRLFKQLLGALRIWYYGSARDESANQDDLETIAALPVSCLRGLRKADWVDEQSLIQTAAFIPDVRTAGTRKDGGKETSVNWEDDADVESFTLSNKNNAQHGAARISTFEIVK